MIRRPDGTLMGYNVDYLGAIAAIEEALRGLLIEIMNHFYVGFSKPMLLFVDFVPDFQLEKVQMELSPP